MTRVIAGTRGSALALRQTALVVEALRAVHPALDVEVTEIRTEGDRDRRTPLTVIGGKGIFVKELEAALLDRRIDFAVHSLKDVPSTLPDGLAIVAVPARGDPRDALVSVGGRSLAELPEAARVGTGSRRRRAELLQLRPNMAPVEIRGNVDTRIRRVHEGAVDGVVLAVAGLERLGRLDEAAQIFSVEELLPAVGQAALGVEVRAEDLAVIELMSAIDDSASHVCVRAERAFLQRLGGGCLTPAAAHCRLEGELLTLQGLVAGEDGTLVRETVVGPVAKPEILGDRLADALVARGALGLIEVPRA